MKPLARECVAKLPPYPPGKPIEELEREMGIFGSIKLASNENALGCSPKAARAITENLHKVNRYPDANAYYLRERLARKFNLPMSRIMVGNGSDELIDLTLHTFLWPDEEVIVPMPGFILYEKFAKAFDGTVITVPLSNFHIDLPAILKAISPQTKIIFINSPHNPAGTAITREETSTFLNALPPDVVVVLDEAYIEFATDPNVVSGVEFLDSYPLLVVLRTFSKVYGLAGLRIGYGLASETIIENINRIRQPFSVNSLAQVGALAALDDGEFVEKTLTTTKEGLGYLYEHLNRLGLEYVPTQANFFSVRTPLGAQETYRRMLKEGVIIRPMDSFGLDNYIRINVGLPEENVRFINTLEKVLS